MYKYTLVVYYWRDFYMREIRGLEPHPLFLIAWNVRVFDLCGEKGGAPYSVH